jgi:DNA-binding response OmpR family regulator
MNQVLVIEDEKDIAGLVKHTLERGGGAVVEVAESGDQALKMASGSARASWRRACERSCGAEVADFDAASISVDGQSIRLTRREFELLRYLVENRNRVLSRDRLLERVWGYDRFVETRSVDVHVGRLRGKLGVAGKQIETVVGLGYRFIEADSSA